MNHSGWRCQRHHFVTASRCGNERLFEKQHPEDKPISYLDSPLWSTDRKTALMVTHDVDEALFHSDRVVIMTNGPNATVGDILTVPFARPRDRAAVMEHPDYDAVRGHLVGFLERQGHKPESHDEIAVPTPPQPTHVCSIAARAGALASPIH